MIGATPNGSRARLGGALAVGLAPAGPAWAQGTFEAVAGSATPASDLGMLAAPALQDCGKARREIDKARCRGMRAALDRSLGTKRYVRVVDEPQVIAVSAYEAGVRGYRMRLVGCLTCQEPVDAGDGEKLWVTLKAPGQGAENLIAGVELARPAMTFANAEEARAWFDRSKPQLRAEFVFAAKGGAWTYKKYRGVAFQPIASRIFNRCTGEVVYSDPPSQGRATPIGGDDCSASSEPKAEAPAAAGGALDAVAINQTLGEARADFEACDHKHKVKGTAYLDFLVAPTGGSAMKVTVKGSLGGTPAAECLIEAALKAKFPKWSGKAKQFQYPVQMRGE
jgi:hypothetical protein